MNSTFSAGRAMRPASATWRPFRPPGRPQIGHQQVDARAGSQQPDGRRAVYGLHGGVAQLLQDLHDEHAHDRLVIHHQDRLALHGASWHDGFGAALCVLYGSAVAGQIDADGGAAADLRGDAGLAAGLPGKAVDHRKAEARAGAHWLGGEERVERPRNDIPAACRCRYPRRRARRTAPASARAHARRRRRTCGSRSRSRACPRRASRPAH